MMYYLPLKLSMSKKQLGEHYLLEDRNFCF